MTLPGQSAHLTSSPVLPVLRRACSTVRHFSPVDFYKRKPTAAILSLYRELFCVVL